MSGLEALFWIYLIGQIIFLYWLWTTDEVENEIREWGQEIACIGDEDVLVIYTAAIDGHEELKKRVSSFLNLHQSVIRIKYIERLPRNQYGKLQYCLLTEHSKRQVN